jgi:hypothetical protein
MVYQAMEALAPIPHEVLAEFRERARTAQQKDRASDKDDFKGLMGATT